MLVLVLAEGGLRGGVLVKVADRDGSGGAGMVVVVGWW